jgi:hypothetical protein
MRKFLESQATGEIDCRTVEPKKGYPTNKYSAERNKYALSRTHAHVVAKILLNANYITGKKGIG